MDLIEHYNEFFYIRKANTPKFLEQAFHLRYEVFIEDCGYKLGDFDETKGIEKDCYDNQAEHCLLFHKPTDKPIGYIRLIPYIEGSGNVLPIETYGENYFDFDKISLDQLRSNKTGELSRLSIHPLFRRRLSDQLHQLYSTDNNENNRYRINYLPVCLVLASIALMFDNNIECTVALMEKRPAILMKRIGVIQQLIGKPIMYHGMRSPYLMYGQRTFDNLKPDYKRLYEIIHDELNYNKIPVFDAKE